MRDTVDAFMAQWASQRPDLEVWPMGLIGRLSRATRLVEHGVKSHLAVAGMEPWEFDVLATLRRCGPPYTLTPKDLVATTMVGSAAMTHRTDRLVERGLITREVDASNRRRLLISLTPEGLELVDRAIEGHVANARRLTDGLDATEREEMVRLLRKLLLSLQDTSPGVLQGAAADASVASTP